MPATYALPLPYAMPFALAHTLALSAQPSTPAPQHSALGADAAWPPLGKRGTLPHSPKPRLRRDGTPPPVALMLAADSNPKISFKPFLPPGKILNQSKYL